MALAGNRLLLRDVARMFAWTSSSLDAAWFAPPEFFRNNLEVHLVAEGYTAKPGILVSTVVVAAVGVAVAIVIRDGIGRKPGNTLPPVLSLRYPGNQENRSFPDPVPSG